MDEENPRESQLDFNSVTSTLSKKGQVTIPSKVRNYIDARPGDQILFTIDGKGKIVVNVAREASLLSLYGSMPPRGETEDTDDWQTIRERAREEMVNKKIQERD